MQNAITDITNLKFYTGNGQELYMLKQYVMTWELIVNDTSQMRAVKENPCGYFVGDVSIQSLDSYGLIDPSTHITSLQAGFINAGRIVVPTQYDPSTGAIVDPETLYCYGTLYDLFDCSVNQIKVSLNIQGSSYTKVFSANSIFTMKGDSSTFIDYFDAHKIYVGDNVNSSEYYTELSFKKVDLKQDATGSCLILSNFNKQVANLAKFFPFVRYYGTFTQDKISENLQAVDTVLVLEKTATGYERPSLHGLPNSYSMLFEQLDPNGELNIIESDNVNIRYVDRISFSLNDGPSNEPFAFTVSVCSDTEGAYLNMITMKMIDNVSKMQFYLGALNVKTEVEGEDTRFRTLMDNFGIPDPKNYLNIFADAEYSEVNKDNILLNQKSKEMFLRYTDIFSYIGTYKALFNAVRYLGYQDIIFKEWYSIKDTNDQQKELAVQVIDVENNTYLQQKLAYYGISIEDFNKYNKLNKISMIYQLNEFDDDNQEIIDISVYDTSTRICSNKRLYFDTQLTKPIYIYRNTEILAKLYSVKNWLEKHIIGVSAYISDVTGEGIYIGSIKTQTYNNNGHVYDFTTHQYHTPVSKPQSKFIDSSIIIESTLAELHEGLTFEEYEYTPIQEFERYSVDISMNSKSGELFNLQLSNSNSLEAPVLCDEYSFELVNRSETGTLYEWSGGKQQMFIDNNRIQLLFNEIGDASISSDKLPVILLENANIHAMHGRWQDNVVWAINETYDPTTGNVLYTCKNTTPKELDNTFYVTSNTLVILRPSKKAEFYFTEQNKQQVPAIRMKGYEFTSLNITDKDVKYAAYKMDSSVSYILEIMKGDILFKKVVDGSTAVGATVSYTSSGSGYWNMAAADSYEGRQHLGVDYTYYSDKLPYTVINDSSIVDETSVKYDFDASVQYMKDAYEKETVFQLTSFKDKVDAVGDKDNPAAIDASKFIDRLNDSTSIEYKDKTAFEKKYSSLYEQRKLYEAFKNAYDSNYIFNSSICTPVTRLGAYETFVKSYDKYNNIYVGTTDKKTRVYAQPLSIDTYISHENSNNEKTFYRYNRSGEMLDSSTELLKLINDSSTDHPLFPKSYRIYDTYFDHDSQTLIFDNINNAVELPMMKDYLIFENLSELCSDISTYDSSTIIYMLDENPRDVIFNIGDKLLLCVYDNILLKDIRYYGPYAIKNISLVDPSTDLDIADDSYIQIVEELDSNVTAELYSYMNDMTNRFKVYAFNNSEYEIKAENILEDTSTGNHVIILDALQHFNASDVIKLRTRYDENLINLCSSTLINETTYKIESVEIDETGAILYKLDGRLNLNNFSVDSSLSFGGDNIDTSLLKTYMMYAHQKMVRYHTILPEDATSTVNFIGYDRNIQILKEECVLDTKFNFIDDYIDNNYSITLYDYDNDYLNRTWFNTSIIDASTEIMYKYHDFPVTVNQNDFVIFNGVDTYGTLRAGFKKSWRGAGLILNDDKNLNLTVYNALNETMYRSENEWLTIRPEVLGPLTVQLTCIDVYGNKVINKGEGKIFVKEAL